VLFLDELPEFDRSVLEVLRQPLEDQRVTISRAAMSLTFPASFMLAAAMNPCPCGFWNDPTRECRCSPMQIQRYVGRIRDHYWTASTIHIDVPAVKFREQACTLYTVPFTLMSNMSASWSGVMGLQRGGGEMPALAHNTSSPPNASTAASAIAIQHSRSDTSTATADDLARAKSVERGDSGVDVGWRARPHRDVRVRRGEHRGDAAADSLATTGDQHRFTRQ